MRQRKLGQVLWKLGELQERYAHAGEFDRSSAIGTALKIITTAAAEAQTARELRRRARDIKRMRAEK
jgi:hypothetical protein